MVNRAPPLRNMKPYGKQNEPVKMLTNTEMSRQKIDRLKSWITWYRKYPSYFIEHYLGVTLYPYQRIWVNWIANSTEFLGMASRASAKSFLIGLYSIAKCILYPGTIVVLASSTKAQAGLIISEKCKSLHDNHPNIQRETSNIVTNANRWEMSFHNGSKILVVVSGESARGNRSNVTVLEERRLIPTEVIDSILRPFLVSRQAPYMTDPKYSSIEELREEPQEIIITSAYYKSHEWWIEAKKFLRMIASGDPDVKGIFLDYLILLKHGIKTKKQMIKEKENFDTVTFGMEYGNIPYGSSATSYYKLDLFNRTVKRSWRPIRDEDVITGKKNIYDIPKLPDEYRIVSVDVAMRAGSRNDNTIITCARLLPTRKGWHTEISYMESHNGVNTTVQALRIKQIYEEFQANSLVLDLLNSGISIFDSLSSVTKDEVRGKEYPAYTVMDDDKDWIDKRVWDELKARTLGADAIGCIFPIAGTPALNSGIAISLKDRLKRKLISFLVDDNAEEEYLIKSGNKDILDQTDSGVRAYLIQSHIQTTLMINECISLDSVFLGGLVKLVEPPSGRKDRFTSLSYLNYFVSLLDIQLLKDSKSEDSDEEFLRLFTHT